MKRIIVTILFLTASAFANEADHSSLILNYQFSKVNTDHYESSGNGSFFNLGEDVRISIHNLGFEYNYEMPVSQKFSMTLIGQFGVNLGVEEESGDGTLDYKEKVYGLNYGAGMSFNYNFYSYDMKIQPFLGFQYVYEGYEFELDYNDSAVGTDKIKIDTDLDRQVVQSTLGVRFIDEKLSLMSYISFDYFYELTSDISTTARINGSEIGLSKKNDPELGYAALTLGIGFTF